VVFPLAPWPTTATFRMSALRYSRIARILDCSGETQATLK
jgi:hypothetical protein